LIDESCKKNKGKKNLNFDEIFEKTSKPARNLYIDRFSLLMKSINNSKTYLHAIFVDKNHPPNGLEKATSLIKDDVKARIELKIIAIAAQCENPLKIKNVEYPFSLNFLVNCLKRGLERKSHETLQGDFKKIVSVILMFFNLYKGFRIKNDYLKGFGFDDLMHLPFVCEEEEGKLSEDIRKKMEDYLGNRKEFQENVKNIEELVQIVKRENVGGEIEKEKEKFREVLNKEWEEFLKRLEKEKEEKEKEEKEKEKEEEEEEEDGEGESEDEEEIEEKKR